MTFSFFILKYFLLCLKKKEYREPEFPPPPESWKPLDGSEKAERIAQLQKDFGGENVSPRSEEFFTELLRQEKELHRKLIGLVFAGENLDALFYFQPLTENIFALRSSLSRGGEIRKKLLLLKSFLGEFENVDLVTKTSRKMPILSQAGFNFVECAGAKNCKKQFPEQFAAYLADPNNPKTEKDYENAWFYVKEKSIRK